MLEVYWAYCAIKSDVRIGQQLPFYDHRKRGVPSRRIDIRARQDLILFIGDLAQKREWGRSDIRNIHDIRMQPMNRINTGRAVIQRLSSNVLGIRAHNTMCHTQHQFILDAPCRVAFQKGLWSGVYLLFALDSHGYFFGEWEGEWPGVIPRKLSIKFLGAGRRRRGRNVWSGRYRTWVTIGTCPGRDGVVKEGAGAALIRTCDHTSAELIYEVFRSHHLGKERERTERLMELIFCGVSRLSSRLPWTRSLPVNRGTLWIEDRELEAGEEDPTDVRLITLSVAQISLQI
jgi:hypothetical protein